MSLSAIARKSAGNVYSVVILPGITTILGILLIFTTSVNQVCAAEENPGDNPGQQGRSLADRLKSTAEDQKPESLVQEPQSTNSVEGAIESRDEVAYDPTTRSIYPGFYYRFRRLLMEWEQKLGLAATFSYDVVGQQYFDDVEYTGGLAGDAAMSGRWLLFGHKKDRPFYLSFRLRTRDAITDNPPSDISSETGLFWKTVDGFNDSGFQVPSMYFTQELRKREVILRFGQFPIDDFFDSQKGSPSLGPGVKL